MVEGVKGAWAGIRRSEERKVATSAWMQWGRSGVRRGLSERDNARSDRQFPAELRFHHDVRSRVGDTLDHVDAGELRIQLAKRVGGEVDNEVRFTRHGIHCLYRFHVAQVRHDIGVALVGTGGHGEAVDHLLQAILINANAVAGDHAGG